jgi:signal transduction histidine kinase
LLALAYVLVLAIVALEVPLATSVTDRVNAEVRSQARAHADVAAATVADLLGSRDRARRDDVVEVVAGSARGRVIVVNRRGRVVADSESSAVGGNYGARPEIRAALAGRRDQRERTSQTLGLKLLATTVPILGDGRPVGAVRITQSVDAVERAVHRSWLGLALIGLVVLGVGLLAGSLIAGQITRPLRRLDAAARRVADGDLTARVEIEGSAEQRSLGRTFNLMTERLQRLVDAQRLFVADASHQLRTPLTGLRLRMESVQGSRLDAQAAEDVQAALDEFDRLAQMIAELLELSRAGERDAAGQLVSLADLVSRAAARWAATASERGQRVTAISRDVGGGGAAAGEDDGGSTWVGSGRGAASAGGGDSAWIAQADADRIVDALVENALRYSPDGIEVEIAAAPGVVEVRDRGAGIAPGERDAVFERFHRGSASRAGAPGSGLGLAIARDLARGWGGDVTMRARPGGGTVAELRLPPVFGGAPASPNGRQNLGKGFAKSAMTAPPGAYRERDG